MLTEVAKQQININSDTAQFVNGAQLEIALLLLEFALECSVPAAVLWFESGSFLLRVTS